MINLLRVGAPAATSLRPVASPAQAPVSERGAVPSAQEVISLEPGKPVERELSGGQSHSYKITMTSGQYLHVVAAQRGIDVAVALFTPDGKKIIEVNSDALIEGSETVSAIAEAAGAYLIEVRSPEKTAKTGRYEIKVGELRAATAKDKDRVAGEAIFREAEQLQKGTLEAKRKSIEKYHESLDLYRRAGAGREEVKTLNSIGVIHLSLGELQKALEKFNEAQPIARAIGDRQGEAYTLTATGAAYRSLGEMQKALEKYNEALPIARAIGDRQGEADVLSNIGIVYWLLGETQKALEKFNEALPIRRAISDRSGEAIALEMLGKIYKDLGETRKALDKHNESLSIIRSLGGHRGEAIALNSLGGVYNLLGEMQKTLDTFNEALSITRANGDRQGEIAVLSNIGMAYGSLGETQKAVDKHNESLSIARAIGARNSEAVSLNHIGNVYQSLGETQKALDKYNEALPLNRAVGDRNGEAITLNNIGRVYQSLGETRKALEKYNEALLISRATGVRSTEGLTLHNIGAAYNSLGEAQIAIANFNEALSIRRAIGDQREEAQTLLGIAQVEQKHGNLTLARQSLEQAINIIESIRADISSQELRASFFASRQEVYQSYVDVLMQMHKQNPAAAFNTLALEASERARARSLLELLTESRADIRQGVDASLLERERSLQQRLNARAAAQVRLLNRKHTPEQAAAAAKEITAITSEYEETQAQIRARSPRYAALTQPQPLGLTEIQQQLLDPDTLLLEYALGKERSHLWVVSRNSINSYELPRSEMIEEAARRAIKLFSAYNPAAYKIETEAATALSQMILGPTAEQLGAKRLLVVADGILQYLPFGALPAPTTEAGGQRSGAQGGQIPLIVKHEIVNLPSASTLALLRREQSGRQPAARHVAVLADPVFDRNDPRLKLDVVAQSAEGKNQSNRPADSQTTLQMLGLERSAKEAGVSFDRLGFSRQEAEAIAALTREGERLKALDFAASRATALSEELGRYRIVHFATHGLLNSQHPELSGLVLSLVDERGQPQDGFLRAHEVYNLKLNADLVVLSGCRTALGKDVKGEGLVGLTRGFMYAGAPRVVASLWQVSDKATADLMKQFYKGMLADGLRPSAALRAAQVAMWKEKRAPYFWAAFVLQGEWH
jgi:CHAT domain-containing protein/tetratricopeptide (TPR) repeat protein